MGMEGQVIPCLGSWSPKAHEMKAWFRGRHYQEALGTFWRQWLLEGLWVMGGTPLKGMGYRKLASSPFTLPSTLWCKWIPLALIPDLQSGVQTNVTTLSRTGTSRTNSQDINFLSFMVNCFRSFATIKWNWLIPVVYSNDKALREKSQSSKPGSLVT